MRIVRRGGYDAFLESWFSAIKLGVFAIAAMSAARLLFVVWFSARFAPETGASDVLDAFWRGLGYDLYVGFYAPLPVIAFGPVNLFLDARRATRRLLHVCGAFYCFLSALAVVASIEYVKEYGDLFNHFLFGLIYDDREAILKMVWDEYGLLPGLVATAVLGYLLYRAYRFWDGLRRDMKTGGWPVQWKISATFALLALLLVFARGGVGMYPLQFRDRDVTQDAFLNKLVLNPWLALKYAFQQQSEAGGGGLFRHAPTLADAQAACRRVAPVSSCRTVEEALAATVPVGSSPRARHLFLIIIESYDSWPYLDKYAGLRLVEEGKKLAAEGIHLGAFLPANTGTMTTLSPMISGIYNPGVRANYQLSSRKPYETAPAAIFADEGYATRLFSGGSLSWQQLGEFARNQGFAEVYGMESIKNARNVNEWGVDDGSLFDFVLSKIDDSRPSFNVILTTGNHPTYSMDLKSVGWTERGAPGELRTVVDGTLPEVILGHLWYSDQTAARFAREAADKLPASLVALTGDHFSRKFVNQRPSVYEATSVPLVLYGPEVLNGLLNARKAVGSPINPDAIAGTHLDILPTFYALSFNAGKSYPAVGRDLFDPERPQVGIGANAAITTGYVVRPEEGAKAERLPWAKDSHEGEIPKAVMERNHDLQLLSWWRIMKGNSLER